MSSLRLRKRIGELLYPPRCPLCDEVFPVGEEICDECSRFLSFVEDPVCLKCGKELQDAEDEYCLDCRRLRRSFVRGYPLLNYTQPVADALSMMKYHDRQEYAAFYGKMIAKKYGAEFRRIGIQCLVPVPISKNKLKKRGYNQARLLADAISIGTGIPVEELLIRTVDTLPQKNLGPEMREKNLTRAFAVADLNSLSRKPHANTVLLVDDIYTTGATIESCTRTLLTAAEVKNVYYTSAAIGQGL